jgi:sterol 3beta-glucosyltransferase
MSRHVCPPPSHWPPHYHMTGFFFLDEEWQPDPALAEFLAAGEPPVVVTFGSMTHSDPNTLTDLILEAIRRVGCRAIIQQGWSGLAQHPLPSNVYAASYVPHGWLFSHATCIVHHGGAGTSGAAFRAGVPSVFVPHTFDQPVWADLAHSLGYCVPPIPYLELSADRLSAAITATLTTPRYQQVATELSEKIRAEQGVRRARLLIEQLVRKIGPHQAEAGSDAGAGRDERISHKRSYQQQQRSRRREKSILGDDQEQPEKG